MAITVLGMDGNPFDQNSVEAAGVRFLRAFCQFKLSGSYVTGGDTLDFTNGGGSLAAPVAIPVNTKGLVSIDIRPWAKTTSAFSAADGQYFVLASLGVVPVPTVNVNALKLKLMLDVATEYSAGAYGTDALADIILAECVWAR
jgi:hypothetical protein